MNQLIQTIFDNRNYTRDYLLDINDHNHALLKDIDVLCQRLRDIYLSGKHITVLPDFDTDGIMSGVVGYAGLAELGFSVSLFIPTPSDGYGFTPETIDRLVRFYPDTQAIITCDVGITCFEGITHGRELGIEMLITDHHKQQGVVHDASAIVNPMRTDETYAHSEICGAHVLYQVLTRYAELYCNPFLQEQIRRLCVFAGIGTVSDVMPLLFENRKLVRDSVSISRMIYSGGNDIMVNYIQGCDTYRRAFRGLFTLYKALADAGTLRHTHDITEMFYGFYLAPVFNSPKRMNGDMSRAFGIFFGSNPEADAVYLISLNAERKAVVEQYMTKLEQTEQPFAPYLYISDAPEGVLGLLATKLCERAGVPVMVVNKVGKKYHGSGRSPVWYPFLDRVVEAGYYAAGHNHAFGVGLTDKKELKSLLAFLCNDTSVFMSQISAEDTEVRPDFVIATDGSGDTPIDIDLFRSYLQELELYRPFGKAFPEPLVKLKFKCSESEWSLIGSEKQHLKISLPYGFEVLCWNQGSLIANKDLDKDIFVIGSLGLNEFNNCIKIQFCGTLGFE